MEDGEPLPGGAVPGAVLLGGACIFSLPDPFHLHMCLEFSGTHLCHYLVIASDNFQLLETQMSRFRNECSFLSHKTLSGEGVNPKDMFLARYFCFSKNCFCFDCRKFYFRDWSSVDGVSNTPEALGLCTAPHKHGTVPTFGS